MEVDFWGKAKFVAAFTLDTEKNEGSQERS